MSQGEKGIATIWAGNSGLSSMLVQIVREEGVRGLYRGFTVATAGAGPAHALYYAVYELTKRELGANRSGHRPLSVAAAGALQPVLLVRAVFFFRFTIRIKLCPNRTSSRQLIESPIDPVLRSGFCNRCCSDGGKRCSHDASRCGEAAIADGPRQVQRRAGLHYAHLAPGGRHSFL